MTAFGPTISITATATDAGILVPMPVTMSGGSTVLCNRSLNDVFVAWGGNQARCTAGGAGAGYVVLGRSKETLRLPAVSHIFFIMEAGRTAEVQITIGDGD